MINLFFFPIIIHTGHINQSEHSSQCLADVTLKLLGNQKEPGAPNG